MPEWSMRADGTKLVIVYRSEQADPWVDIAEVCHGSESSGRQIVETMQRASRPRI